MKRRAGAWRQFVRVAGVAGALAVVAGCSTPYKEDKGWFSSGGYQEKELAPDVYLVRCHGNAYTGRETVRLFVYYRCAELTLAKGADYFAEVQEVATGAGPKFLYSSPSGTYGVPGAPGAQAIVRLFKGEKPADVPNVHNARELKAEIDEKYFKRK